MHDQVPLTEIEKSHLLQVVFSHSRHKEYNLLRRLLFQFDTLKAERDEALRLLRNELQHAVTMAKENENLLKEVAKLNRRGFR